MKTNEQYVKNSGHCPRCNSSDIEGDAVNLDGDTAWQYVTCTDCDLEWTDNYHLASYEVTQS